VCEIEIQARERVKRGLQWLQDEGPSDWLFRISNAFGEPQALLNHGWLKDPGSLLIAIFGEESGFQIKDLAGNPVGPTTVWSIASGLGLSTEQLIRSGFLLPRYFGPRARESAVGPFIIIEWEEQLKLALQRSMLPNKEAA